MLLKAWRQPLRSSASASQVSMSMPVSSRSRLQTSLTRSAGRPIGRHPVANSPYKRSFGIRPSSMRRTWPRKRSLHLQSMRCTLREPAFSSTATLVTLSYQVMPMIRRKQCIWKLSRRFSCLAYVVQDSLPYNKVPRTHAWYTLSLVLKVSWLFSQTFLLNLDLTAAALAMRLSIFESRDKFAGHSRAKVKEMIGDLEKHTKQIKNIIIKKYPKHIKVSLIF